jgi:hypothetical protein
MGHVARVSVVVLLGWFGMRRASRSHALLLAKRHGDRAVALHRQPQRNQRD